MNRPLNFALRLAALVLILSLAAVSALADPLPLGEPLTGSACWPEDADPATAPFLYTYSYPFCAGEDDVSGMINEYYYYAVDDALAFVVPIAGESLEPSDVQATTQITGVVTCNNDDFFCVLVTNESFMGASTSLIYSAQTFARTGDRAGSVVSLPYLLGILDSGDASDEWLETRQTDKADACVRQLVWDIIQEQIADGSVPYYDDLTFEQLCAFFYPEEDFYLDEDGNPVFFLEEGMAAPQTEGALFFPFTIEELLDEI